MKLIPLALSLLLTPTLSFSADDSKIPRLRLKSVDRTPQNISSPPTSCKAKDEDFILPEKFYQEPETLSKEQLSKIIRKAFFEGRFKELIDFPKQDFTYYKAAFPGTSGSTYIYEARKLSNRNSEEIESASRQIQFVTKEKSPDKDQSIKFTYYLIDTQHLADDDTPTVLYRFSVTYYPKQKHLTPRDTQKLVEKKIQTIESDQKRPPSTMLSSPRLEAEGALPAKTERAHGRQRSNTTSSIVPPSNSLIEPPRSMPKSVIDTGIKKQKKHGRKRSNTHTLLTTTHSMATLPNYREQASSSSSPKEKSTKKTLSTKKQGTQNLLTRTVSLASVTQPTLSPELIREIKKRHRKDSKGKLG